jgi:hypothetical protein
LRSGRFRELERFFFSQFWCGSPGFGGENVGKDDRFKIESGNRNISLNFGLRFPDCREIKTVTLQP